MKKSIGISLVILSLLGLMWGAFWGPLVPSKDKVITVLQGRMDSIKQKSELKKLNSCVNKNPNMTLVNTAFSPSLSVAAPQGRTLLLTVTYAIDLSLSEEIKETAFGEAHRTLFICALDIGFPWERMSIYYLNLTPIYVFDDAKKHITATFDISITLQRDFAEEVVLEKDIFALLIASVGMSYEVPTPKIIFFDLSYFGMTLSGEGANGDVGLALKRYNAALR